MHIFRYSVILHECVSSFFMSRNTAQNINHAMDTFHRIIQPEFFTKPTGFHSVFGKKAVKYNPRIILLLITLLMFSGVIIPCVRAASPLVVDFNADPQFGARPLDVQFNDTTSSADPANNTYLWKFGDGTSSTLKDPLHTYTSSGIYTVNLTVKEITGNKATLSKLYLIHVADTANATDFSGTPQCGFSPLPVQFIDGTTLPHDTWQWDFGDGGASNVSDPQYTYNGQGSWDVSLYISNTSGGPQSLISKSGYIQVIPVAVPSFSATGTRDNTTLTVQFNDTSTGFVSPVEYFWDFGDGTNAIEQNPSHTYADPTLNYLVSFTVSGYCGQTDTQLGYISASGGSLALQPTSVPLAPDADFTGAPQSGDAPLDVTFEDLSANGPTSWSWLFGDGNSSTLRNPVHTYASPGNYTVSLTAFNSVGSSSKTRNAYINVSGYVLAPPQGPVDFTGTPTSGTAPLTVQFTAFSTGFTGPETYLWDFGDNGTSTTKNATHLYTDAGSYTVSLIVTGSDGYSVTLAKPEYINTGLAEIPTLELVLAMDETVANSLAQPTQTLPMAQSVSMAKSARYDQSIPMAQSASPVMLTSDDQSMPQDSSVENGLSASTTNPNTNPMHPAELNNWILHPLDNENTSVYMKVESNGAWWVYVYDAEVGKICPRGRMAQYHSSAYVVNPCISLHNPLYVQSEFLKPLSATHELIQTGLGTRDNNKKFYITFRQYVEPFNSPNRDSTLPTGDTYHIVVTFEAMNSPW
jgi:PKD repeat protein